ncbi:CHAT domain-containing WD40 repeat protein [Streptomyces sp. HB2AG]|uniref:CHAT domain-containing WD40 repeat protein n=1 Tax=Streptomyces sp. HB2AG TaxID=2983400 RepID=UPI0022AABC5B|nr:CHAT domain-containing protein [Streptomyces sp. HB2AG]MCZ2525284.1 CHAT domain-containing protein [Streptomyces sp. HB2AG]
MGSHSDFVIEIGGEPGRYEVTVSSPAGEDSAVVALDAPLITGQLPLLQAAVLGSAVRSRAVASEMEEPARQVGEELFRAVFQEAIGGLYLSSLQRAREHDEDFRVVMRLRSPELTVLPWELMHSSKLGGYLCLDQPMVRYIEVLEPVAPLRISPPLRVLGMVSLPSGRESLDLETERRNLQEALAPLTDEGLVELDWAPGQTVGALRTALLRGCHVLHISGHGTYDTTRREGALLFADERGGEQLVHAGALRSLISLARPRPRLVLLNSCQTGAGNQEDLFSSTAAALEHTVPAVVAMQFAISDHAAVVFSQAFYEAVAVGRPVDEAVRIGRIALQVDKDDSLEWVTPVLYLRSGDATLFEVDSVPDPLRRARREALEAHRRASREGGWDEVVRRFSALHAQLPDDSGVARLLEEARAALRYETEFRVDRTEPGADRPGGDRGATAPREHEGAPAPTPADVQEQVRPAVREEAPETAGPPPGAPSAPGPDDGAAPPVAVPAAVSGEPAAGPGRGAAERAEPQDAEDRPRRQRTPGAPPPGAEAGAPTVTAAPDADATPTAAGTPDADAVPDTTGTPAVTAAPARAGAAEEADRVLPVGQWVLCMAVHADGSLLATGSRRRVRVWDLDSERLLWESRTAGWTCPVFDVAFSPDGRLLAACGADNLARIFDAPTGEPLLRMRHDHFVKGVSFSPDGNRLATAGADRTWRIWSADDGELLLRIRQSGGVNAVAFAPEGHRVATGSSDRSATLWDPDTGRPLLRIHHDGAVNAVAFAPDGHRVATGSSDRSATLWDPDTGRPLLRVHHGGAVRDVAFAPDGGRLATAGEDRAARLWDTADGACLRQVRHDHIVHAVAFAPDGGWFASGGEDKAVRITRLDTGRPGAPAGGPPTIP